tara:strand:+ start:185 stop:868 length:684 start_codon:yes stop_codon:yes gene_type:complete
MEKYPGKELEIFDKAIVFQKYIYFLTKKFLKNKTLEVGAGLGSFTRNYFKEINDVSITEIDQNNFNILKEKFKNEKINIFSEKIQHIEGKFESIIYLNVLEHIESDLEEIDDALSKLCKGGYLIIVVPAHQELFTNFDREIGHFRRYDKKFFNRNYNNASIEKLIYIDAMGYFLYFLNKVIFTKETYPSSLKVQIWDKIFTPITILVDFILGYKFGKNVLCVLKKTQ